MKKIIIFMFLLTVGNVYAQQPAVPTVELRGIGESKQQPDQGYLHIEILGKSMNQTGAITELNKRNDKLVKQLQKIGFDQAAIKTVSFNVHQNIHYRNGEARDSGFVARQNLIVEFVNTKERIANIVNSFSQSAGDARFHFTFGLSDAKMKEVKNHLIKLAIEDAKQKASLIAETSGKQLGDIIEIKYGLALEQFQPPVFARASRMEDASSSQGFEVKEITMDDYVIIKWGLK